MHFMSWCHGHLMYFNCAGRSKESCNKSRTETKVYY